MDKYIVKLMPRAERDLDGLYAYLTKSKTVPEVTLNIIKELEEMIFSFESMPYRGVQRKVGSYLNNGYRQVFLKNFTIIYRIDEWRHFVIITTIQYAPEI